MNIFDKIENFSYKLSCLTVKKEKNLTGLQIQEEIEIWNYFYFLILSQMFTFFFVILFGLIFKYFDFLIFSLFSFCYLRTKSGGYHCDSFEKCFITTNISFIIIGIFSKIFYFNFLQWYELLFLLSMIGVVFIIPSSPLAWGNEESRGEEDKKFQLEYRNRVIILYIINIILLILSKNFNYIIIKKSIIGISFGLVLAGFSGSISGSKFLDKLWNKK